MARRRPRPAPDIGDGHYPVHILFARPHDALPADFRRAMQDAGLRPHGEYEWTGRVWPEALDALDHDAEHAEGLLTIPGERGAAVPDAAPRGPGLSHAELRRWREDAERRVAETPPDLLSAVDCYRSEFGAAALPHLFGVPDMRVAERMLLDAVERGQPLRGWQIMRSFGLCRPPVGASY